MPACDSRLSVARRCCSPTRGSRPAGTRTPAAWRRPSTAGTVTGPGAPWRCSCAAGCGTAGLVAAGFAAAACARARGESAALVLDDGFWPELDAEADARTPSPAQREASRRQGRALLRAARAAWPGAAGLAGLAAAAGTRGTPARGGPHHAVVLGAAAAAAGCLPPEAALIAAYQSVAGPASAAVRLLALDPMLAAGMLAGLAGDIDAVAAQGAGCAERAARRPALSVRAGPRPAGASAYQCGGATL